MLLLVWPNGLVSGGRFPLNVVLTAILLVVLRCFVLLISEVVFWLRAGCDLLCRVVEFTEFVVFLFLG